MQAFIFVFGRFFYLCCAITIHYFPLSRNHNIYLRRYTFCFSLYFHKPQQKITGHRYPLSRFRNSILSFFVIFRLWSTSFVNGKFLVIFPGAYSPCIYFFEKQLDFLWRHQLQLFFSLFCYKIKARSNL